MPFYRQLLALCLDRDFFSPTRLHPRFYDLHESLADRIGQRQKLEELNYVVWHPWIVYGFSSRQVGSD